MKKIKYSFAALTACIFTLTAFTSCDEGGEPEPGGTATERFAGDWFITVYDAELNPLTDYMLYSTYNAASNDENLWIDDHNNPQIQLKSKVQVNFDNDTFSGPALADELYTGGTVTIRNGKLIRNGGTTTGGHTVDSLYFEAEFDWDPGTFYSFGGHKRTGFLEDEH